MKRASEVPPSVASSGFSFLPVDSEIAFVIMSVNSPFLFRKDLALISSVKLHDVFFWLENTSLIFSFNQSIKDSAVCWSLKRMLIVALAYSGITLCAGLPTSKVATCTDVGKKNSLPLSSGSERILVTSLDRWWTGFSPLWPFAVCPWTPFAVRKKLIEPLLPILILSPIFYLR